MFDCIRHTWQLKCVSLGQLAKELVVYRLVGPPASVEDFSVIPHGGWEFCPQRTCLWANGWMLGGSKKWGLGFCSLFSLPSPAEAVLSCTDLLLGKRLGRFSILAFNSLKL